MPEAVMSRQHQMEVERGRNCVLVDMLLVCALSLETDGGDGEARLRAEAKLTRRMTQMPGGRSAFGGMDGRREFRKLAWDAATQLVKADHGEDAIRWAKVLRELLGQLPECDALAA